MKAFHSIINQHDLINNNFCESELSSSWDFLLLINYFALFYHNLDIQYSIKGKLAYFNVFRNILRIEIYMENITKIYLFTLGYVVIKKTKNNQISNLKSDL